MGGGERESGRRTGSNHTMHAPEQMKGERRANDVKIWSLQAGNPNRTSVHRKVQAFSQRNVSRLMNTLWLEIGSGEANVDFYRITDVPRLCNIRLPESPCAVNEISSYIGIVPDIHRDLSQLNITFVDVSVENKVF